jgi:7-keto-8-aminopelargonate synthetase-like enzyme
MSPEFDGLSSRLQANLTRLRDGLTRLGLIVQGGITPIVSVLVGGEEETLKSGSILFDQGYYVQSVTFPAVPYHAGVLRIQVNANHTAKSIDGLIEAMGRLLKVVPLPRATRAPLAA